MDVTCNKCSRNISTENINISKDTAFCSTCKNLTSLSGLLKSSTSSKFNIRDKVSGTKYFDNGNDWKVEASHRSFRALFLVPFTIVWAGGSLSGIYGAQITEREFNLGQSLFGLPFLLGSIVLIAFTLMSIFGRTIVSNKNGKALIFIGIGSIGWYRHFEWRTIDRVIENRTGQYKYISLEGSKRLNLGWGVSGEKLYYVLNVLRLKLTS